MVQTKSEVAQRSSWRQNIISRNFRRKSSGIGFRQGHVTTTLQISVVTQCGAGPPAESMMGSVAIWNSAQMCSARGLSLGKCEEREKESGRTTKAVKISLHPSTLFRRIPSVCLAATTQGDNIFVYFQVFPHTGWISFFHFYVISLSLI